MSDRLGPKWDVFEQDGHTFVKALVQLPELPAGTLTELWTCPRCGATKDRNNYTSLPDDSWTTMVVDGQERWIDTCDEGQELMVRSILES